MRTSTHSTIRRGAWLVPVLLAACLLSLPVAVRAAIGPAIDWDPAYGWQAGGSPTNLPSGGEFKMVGVVSKFDIPFADLHADDPTREYTFVLYGLISNGTVAQGPPATTIYTTSYTGGTFELYEDLTPDAVLAPNPPNASVPSTFADGTLLLTGSFSSFLITTNNFTALNIGSTEGDITWTGGTLLPRTFATGQQACPGLFMGGITWVPSLMPAGYLFRQDGKMDLQCPTPARGSTWGRLKSLYR